MGEQRAAYDSPWKEALEHYFAEFMAFFFPQAAGEIVWGQGYEFLDKELQQIAPDAQVGTRAVDKLVKVWRGEAEEAWVLVHVEVQSQRQAGFAERMYVYNYRLFDRSRGPVVSLALLTDDQPHWRSGAYVRELWGCRAALDFPVAKPRDFAQRARSPEAQANPFSVVVQVGVAYDSDLEYVERVTIEVARETMLKYGLDVENFPPFIRYHTFGDSSINFSVIMKSKEFGDKFALRHDFIKALHARYRQEGIEIPFPIRTVYLNQDQIPEET
jgi:hypothetical protein